MLQCESPKFKKMAMNRTDTLARPRHRDLTSNRRWIVYEKVSGATIGIVRVSHGGGRDTRPGLLVPV